MAKDPHACNRIFCIYEDRPKCEVGVRLAILSLSRSIQHARVVVFTPRSSAQLRDWIATQENVSWQPSPSANSHGWDTKPYCLLKLLEKGAREVVWLDSDLIVTGDLIEHLEQTPVDSLIVAEEPSHLPYQGTGVRTKAWTMPPSRELGFTVNTSFLRVRPLHQRLLEQWASMVEHPEYAEAQKLEMLDRPFHLSSDQDLLGALLGSEEFSSVQVTALRAGTQIVHSGGLLMDRLWHRLRRVFGVKPILFHAIAMKPWDAFEKHGSVQGFKWSVLRLALETSEYVTIAHSYRKKLGVPCPWMDWRTPMGRFLLLFEFLGKAVPGLPLALAAETLRLFGLKRISRPANPKL